MTIIESAVHATASAEAALARRAVAARAVAARAARVPIPHVGE
jgi:hypothetical protein